MIDVKESNHTNRELELMLSGKKPFAIFSDDISVYPDEIIFPESTFQPYLDAGIFIKEAFTIETKDFISSLHRNAVIKYIAYAVPNELWRIDAYKQLAMIRHSYPHTFKEEGFERYECALLGYSEDETNAWLQHMANMKKQFSRKAI